MTTEPNRSHLLIQAEELAPIADRDDVVVVDCRFDLLNPTAGRTAWKHAHIPGAYYADLDKDLASPRSGASGRHPLPDPADFGATLGSWGVQPDTLVVAYDDVGGAIAARLWWLLNWVGHRNTVLLDGGLRAWLDTRLPMATEQPPLYRGAFSVTPGGMPVLGTAEVEAGLAQDGLAVLDARDAARFAGEVEPIDALAGHIPGTLNRPFSDNLDATGRFRASADLRDSFERLILGADRLACMCGSGVTACHNIFALTLAGIRTPLDEPPALYVGSWSEWIVGGDRPVLSAASLH